MENKQIASLIVTLMILQILTSCSILSNTYAQTTPDVYIGIDLSYGDVEEAKALIDQVSSYTNLIVIGTTKITWYPDKVNEIFQYAYDKGLSFISLPPSLPDYSSTSMNKTEWYEYAKNTWGNQVLGFYYLDEPAGRQLDLAQNWIGNNASNSLNSYANAAYQFTNVISQNIGSNERSGYSYKAFTSDYALYWFDYKAGYDTIFAEFGWNYSRQLNVVLCRGAATAHNKDWGAIVTWTYTDSPYIEGGEELYNDLVLAYDNGAKYILIFDGNEGWTQGILQPEHFDALKRFWEYVQSNSRKSSPVSERTAYVLPNAYGFGFRGPQDHIWGLWEADDLSYNVSIDAASLLDEYGEKLDIIYEDGLQSGNIYGYNQLIYWDSYSPPLPEISILSPENKTYAIGNVSLTFAINKPVTWIGYSLDDQAQVSITENITLCNLLNGRHNVTVYAKDKFESMGVSETIHFIIDQKEKSAPFPTELIVAVSVASIAVVGVGLTLYFRKIKRRK
jgi:hypothetical protein